MSTPQDTSRYTPAQKGKVDALLRESGRVNGQSILSQTAAEALQVSSQLGTCSSAPNFTLPLALVCVGSFILHFTVIFQNFTLALLGLSLLCDLVALVFVWRIYAGFRASRNFQWPVSVTAKRDAKIRALYNGSNADELARHYGLSTARVLLIVRKGSAS